MHICYLLEDTTLWGGVKVVFEQAEALQERGHRVEIVSKGGKPDWYDLHVPLRQVSDFTPSSIPECDFVIATFWTTIRPAADSGKGQPVHLCQGYEGDIAFYAPRRAEIEEAYQLVSLTLTINEPLAGLLGSRFGKKAQVIGQGIDHEVFFAGELRASRAPWRVLLVGPYEADMKGIRDGLLALKALKTDLPLCVVRVSQFPCTDDERDLGVTDEYRMRLRSHEMAALYRSCDALLGPYWAQEGFGLPVLEAIACGLPTVVSNIPSLRAFADRLDWTIFFGERDLAGMEAGLRRLFADETLRRQFRSRGLEIARNYTFGRVVERLEGALRPFAGSLGIKSEDMK